MDNKYKTYSAGQDYSRSYPVAWILFQKLVLKEEPCMFNNIKPGTVMGLVCNCSKCSVR